MPSYQAPLRDMRFVAEELLDLPGKLEQMPDFADIGMEDVMMILDETAKFAAQRVQPINLLMDEQGCKLENGRVTVPAELKQAFRDYVEAGWLGLCCDPDDGGQGLPQTIWFMVNEMLTSASNSFSDYVGLCISAYKLVRSCGSDELKQLYLAKMVTGDFTATMCMTEPHCGTDVGILKTKAEPAGDGTYQLTGTKIFISAGDHDMAENILHLVIARVAGDPDGPRGISLFLVPKILPDGKANSVVPTGLEHKMGYNGSATCQMSFEGATGWMLGERCRGLIAMFQMVNSSRLAVALQGLSNAEASYQGAAQYAAERLQGRAATGPKYPDKPADPIIVHADVRRMLLSMRAFIEAARAVYLWLGLKMDLAEHHPDEAARHIAARWLDLMTTVAKAVLSDFGFNATVDGMQVFGGHGYIRETGMEIFVRDTRLAQIQEGANGMLAANMIKRELLRSDDAYVRFVGAVQKTIDEYDQAAMSAYIDPLAKALEVLEDASDQVRRSAAEDKNEIGAAGVDYQRVFGLTLFAWFWARMAAIATDKVNRGEDPDGFYQNKLITARYFMERMLPMQLGYRAAMAAGAASMMDPGEGYFH